MVNLLMNLRSAPLISKSHQIWHPYQIVMRAVQTTPIPKRRDFHTADTADVRIEAKVGAVVGEAKVRRVVGVAKVRRVVGQAKVRRVVGGGTMTWGAQSGGS